MPVGHASSRWVEVNDSTNLLFDETEVGELSHRIHSSTQRRSLFIGVFVVLAAALGIVAWTSSLPHALRRLAQDATTSLLGAVLVTSNSSGVRMTSPDVAHMYKCGKMEEDIDYVYASLAGAGHIDNIASASQCCALCSVNKDCAAFTWVKDANLWFGDPGQCWLKGGDMIDKVDKTGVISALASGSKADKMSSTAAEDLAAESPPPPPVPPPAKKDPRPSAAEQKLKERAAKFAEEISNEKAEEELMKRLAASLAKDMAKEKALAEELSASADKAPDSLALEIDKRLDMEIDKRKGSDKTSMEELTSAAPVPVETTTTMPTTSTPPPTAEPEHQTVVEEKKRNCAGQNEGCLDSKCCRDPGYRCYTKNDYWAQCMPSCFKGPNPVDQVSPLSWECKELGDRASGVPETCALDNEDCIPSKCCQTAGTTCFTKNATFARCKTSCSPGPDLKADDNQPWSCDKVGRRTMGSAPWVPETCSKVGTDCSETACCADPGHQCYRQTPWYSECKTSCIPGEEASGGATWSCEKIGWRTPKAADDAKDEGGQIGKWVEQTCAKNGVNCLESQCCRAVGSQCVKKNKYWAACRLSCSTTPDPKDNNETWSCEALGPKSWGLATKGYPSLYCISLYMPSSYERGLLKQQLDLNGGIFVCDGYDVFAAEDDELGTSKDGILVKPVLIPKIKVGKSQDGTAGNAKLFMAVWDAIIAGGRFRNYDWTLKVDPDAVVLPWRVREHMAPHSGESVYVVNCNKFPDSPNFPMMYGSLEIFSGPAMARYAAKSSSCGKELPWGPWGEDYFMTKCMDYIGVGRIADFGVIGDDVCTGANCADTYTGAFHPFKDVDSWKECWTTATQAAPEAP